MNVDETKTPFSTEEMSKHSDIPGTPFTLIEKNKLYKISLGRFVLTGDYDTADEALEAIPECKNWEFLINLNITLTKSVQAIDREEGEKWLKETYKTDKLDNDLNEALK